MTGLLFKSLYSRDTFIMRLTCTALCLASLALSGCWNSGSGVHFADIPEFNKALPEDFKRRVLWNETDIFKYNLQQLAGHVIYSKDTPGEYERGRRFVKQDKSPSLQVVDSGQVYHSKIDNAASIEGNYLAFASTLKANQTASVTITDTAQVFIAYEDVPLDELLEEAKTPPPSGMSRRYYIQGVLLATVLTQYGNEIRADASGVLGTAFGAKGNIYNEEQNVTRDFRISMLLIDLDMLARLHGANAVAASDTGQLKQLLENARADGFIVQRISEEFPDAP